MIAASPRNCSGVRSPRGILTSTATNPSCFCSTTFARRKRSSSELSPFGLPWETGAGGAAVSSSKYATRCSTEKSRSATQSPSSSSSTWRRSSSMPYLSTKTLMRARARFARSHS